MPAQSQAPLLIISPHSFLPPFYRSSFCASIVRHSALCGASSPCGNMSSPGLTRGSPGTTYVRSRISLLHYGSAHTIVCGMRGSVPAHDIGVFAPSRHSALCGASSPSRHSARSRRRSRRIPSPNVCVSPGSCDALFQSARRMTFGNVNIISSPLPSSLT
jgi:hypothetical protein